MNFANFLNNIIVLYWLKLWLSVTHLDCEDSKLLHLGILNILISKKIGILPQMISIIIILKTCYREFNTFSSLIKLTNGWNFLLCSLLKILTMQLLCFFPVVCSIIESCFFLFICGFIEMLVLPLFRIVYERNANLPMMIMRLCVVFFYGLIPSWSVYFVALWRWIAEGHTI